MNNLIGLQIGDYICLSKIKNEEEMAVYKACHYKDSYLVRLNVYNRTVLQGRID